MILRDNNLRKEKIEIIQINLGNLCNQACEHCHIDASPQGTDNMSIKTAKKISKKLLELKSSKILQISTIEFTGGAPEMNQSLGTFIEELSPHYNLVVRSNLTILNVPEYQNYIDLFKTYNVKIISSLPSIFEDLTDSQRGKGTYAKSIAVLKKLNKLGFGTNGLKLDLVYNPTGAFLPPSQEELEKKYKKYLNDSYSIQFNNLITIVNNPIKRFKSKLDKNGKLSEYIEMLKKNFNSATLENIMCRHLISINYKGNIYDCDFNLAMRKYIKGYKNKYFWEIDFSNFTSEISLDDYCYACTVNNGSSCHGELNNNINIKDVVQNYYGNEIKKTSDLKTTACCTTDEIPEHIKETLSLIADEIIMKFYGCGSPIPLVLNNLNAVDLGCGTGRDVYVLSKLIGEEGFVTGIDMTRNQIDIANKYINHHTKIFNYQKPNVSFILDDIEKIEKHIKKNSIDLVTSNCVINLIEDKESVLESVFSILKNGGEFYFSDVYSDRRIPLVLKNNEVLYGECLGGALYHKDFIQMSIRVGFSDPRIVKIREIEITNKKVKAVTGNIKFYSITYRLWKIIELEDACEDYGHIAIYRGGIKESPFSYTLDKEHIFEKDKPVRVCGNSARMLSNTRLSSFFEIIGTFEQHFGAFEDCSTDDRKENNLISGCC